MLAPQLEYGSTLRLKQSRKFALKRQLDRKVFQNLRADLIQQSISVVTTLFERYIIEYFCGLSSNAIANKL
jgi:hypothetical protein